MSNKSNYIILFILVVLITSSCTPENVGEEPFFIQTIATGRGNDMKETPDQGYVVIGTIPDITGNRMFIAKYNIAGEEIWSKFFPGNGKCVSVTKEGNYLFGAETDTTLGNSNPFIIVTNPEGNIILQKEDRSASTSSKLNSIKQVSDGNYVMAGAIWNPVENYYNAYLNKYDSQGNILAQNTTNFQSNLISFIEMGDRYLFTGQSIYPDPTLLIQITDLNFKLKPIENIDSTIVGFDIIKTSDQTFILSSKTQNNETFLYKQEFDQEISEFDLIQQFDSRKYNPIGTESISAMTTDASGNIYLAGNRLEDINGNKKLLIIRLDNEFNLLNKSIVETGSGNLIANQIAVTKKNKIIILATMEIVSGTTILPTTLLIKTNIEGKLE